MSFLSLQMHTGSNLEFTARSLASTQWLLLLEAAGTSKLRYRCSSNSTILAYLWHLKSMSWLFVWRKQCPRNENCLRGGKMPWKLSAQSEDINLLVPDKNMSLLVQTGMIECFGSHLRACLHSPKNLKLIISATVMIAVGRPPSNTSKVDPLPHYKDYFGSDANLRCEDT